MPLFFYRNKCEPRIIDGAEAHEIWDSEKDRKTIWRCLQCCIYLIGSLSSNVHYSSRKFRERVRAVILVRVLCAYNSSSNTITWSKTSVHSTRTFLTSGFLSADTGEN